MKTVIYADILFVINLFVNYLLLRSAAIVCSSDFKAWRLLISSVVGGLFSLMILIEGIPKVLDAVMRILLPTVMVIIAFPNKSLKAFLKNTAAFYLANFVFAGLMLGICTASKSNFILYRNGVVYFDIDIMTLTVISLLCYGVLSLISRFVKARNSADVLYSIRITDGGNSIEGTAFYDTGNALCDSFSGLPVIIAERSFLEGLYGKDFECSTLKNFRLIPFTTIKNGGALPAFSAEKVEIKCGGEYVTANRIYIAVTERKINTAGQHALLGPNVLDSIDNKITPEKRRNRHEALR